MSIHIDIILENEAWRNLDWKNTCQKAIITTCAVLGFEKSGELSVAIVSDARIQELNKNFRHKDKATNVLSFPMEGPMLGDIVLARETITEEAAEQGKSFKTHLTHLIIHGFLHLLGYDHMDEKSAAAMESIEIAALTQLGIDNPYELNDS